MNGRLRRLAALGALLAGAALGQSPGYLSNSNLTGAPNYGSFLTSKVDAVNLGNGGLTINIPLVERDARGTSFSLREQFGSKLWVVVPWQYPCGIPYGAQTCTQYAWQPSTDDSAGWQAVQEPGGGYLNYNEEDYACDTALLDGVEVNPEIELSVYSNFTWTAPDGTHYQFPNRVIAQLPGYGSCWPDDGDGNNATTVAGYGENLIGTSDSGQMQLTLVKTSGFFNSTLLSRDGAQPGIEDAQGNVCCGSAGGWTTDAMDRPVLKPTGSPGWPTAFNYYDANGVEQAVGITYVSAAQAPAFPTTNCAGSDYCWFGTGTEGSAEKVSAITLANGLQYQFSYGGNDIDGTPNVFGEVTGMTLPNGGSIAYKWQTLAQFDQGPYDATYGQITLDARVLAERDVNDGAGHISVWTYNYTSPAGTVVTDPMLNDTAHLFGVPPCTTYEPNIPLEAKVESFSGSYASGTPLRKVETTWDCDSGPVTSAQPGFNMPYMTGDPEWTDSPTTVGPRNTRVVGVKTTLEDVSPNQVRQTTTDYGAGQNYTFNNHTPLAALTFNDNEQNPDTVTETDWGGGGPGAVLRITNNTWWDYGAQHILGLLWQKLITDGAGTQLALTNYRYDTNPVATTSGAAAGHDYTNYSSTNTTRGLLTETSAWVSGSSSLISYRYYNDLGELIAATDPAGNSTQYSYADAWAPATTGACAPAPGAGLAYVTAITNALSQTTTRTVNACDGSLASETDPNTQTWSWTWDRMGRLTDAQRPDVDAYGNHGETTYTYNDVSGGYNTETKQRIDAARWTDAWTYFDGLGRPTLQSSGNDEATPWDQVLRRYDPLGRASFISYPCQGASAATAASCTSVGDTFAFDALSRPILTTHSDGTTFITSYTGRATETQDEGNGTVRVTKVTQSDGLGNPQYVCEVTGATDAAGNVPAACPGMDLSPTGFETVYQHDGLGNLLQAAQPGTATSLTRNFQYDGLSRLLCAANPEAGASSGACTGPLLSNTLGATVYTFDADSNVLTRTRPTPNQFNPAVTSTATYGWDALDRPLTTSYSDGLTTPSVTRVYDSASWWWGAETYPVGRIVGAYTGVGLSGGGSVASPNYDQMGRVTFDGNCTPATCGWGQYDNSYAYDLAGDPILHTTVEGTGITITYDGALRATAMTSSWVDATHPATLASGWAHNAYGEGVGGTLGNGLTPSWVFDARGRMLGYNYGPLYNGAITTMAADGAVLSSGDSVNGDWSNQYDPLGRLAAAAGPSGSFAYQYDRYGNRWQQNVTAGTGPAPSFSFAGGNNRIDGWSYDADGNLLYDGAHRYTYDDENRLIGVDWDNTPADCSLATACYQYDTEGRRVWENLAGTVREFIYAPFGQVRSVMDSSQNLVEGEIEFAGQHLATYEEGNTDFSLMDWLGNERVRANASGAQVAGMANLPFGELSSWGSDSRYFTGKPWDAESGLDYFGARYYNSTLGRFMTPDWSEDPDPIPYADLENPQSLNLYSYAGNNPVSRTDADGHFSSGGAYPGQGLYAVALSDGEDPGGDGGLTDLENVYDDAGGIEDVAAARDRATDKVDKDKLAQWMDAHAQPTSTGACAKFCRQGLEAVGMDTSDRPEDAKDYGPFLERHGATAIPNDANYKPQKGDFAVFAGTSAHPHGHVEVYDGDGWVSDFKQKHYSPYSSDTPPSAVYRFPDATPQPNGGGSQ